LKDLARLDTAICNQNDRLELLNIVSSTWFEFQSVSVVNIANVGWINGRSLKMQRIDVQFEFESEKWMFFQITTINWTRLISFRCAYGDVKIHNRNIDLMQHWELLFSNNKLLTELDLYEIFTPNLEQFLILLGKNVPKIIDLKVQTSYTNTGIYLYFLQPVFLGCKHLLSVVLSENSSQIHVNVYSENSYDIYFTNIGYEKKACACLDIMLLKSLKLTAFRVEGMFNKIYNFEDEAYICDKIINVLKQQVSLRVVHVHFIDTSIVAIQDIRVVLKSNPFLVNFKAMFWWHPMRMINFDYDFILSNELATLFTTTDHKLKSLHVGGIDFMAMNIDDVNVILAASPQLINFKFDMLPVEFNDQLIRQSVDDWCVYPPERM